MDTKKLRQKILDLAIHGKLVPQDPNDEPASVLLERIKAEKERLIKEGKIKGSKKSAKTSDTPHYPYLLPKGWKWANITEVTSKITDGTHNSPVNLPIGDYKYVTAKNIKTLGVVLDNITYVSKEVHDEIYARCNPEKGDILYIKDGATTGIVTINTLEEPFSLLSSVALIKPIKEISNKFLCYFLQSPLCYASVRDSMKGVGITRITLKQIEKWDVPLPPLAEQHRIVTEIERWFSLINIIENNKEDLQTTIKQTKNKILDFAIHGKLVPQDPTDESAIELLKRINPNFTPCDNGHSEKLPQGWYSATINDVCLVIGGVSYNKADIQDTGIRVLRGGNIQSGKVFYCSDDVFIPFSYQNKENQVQYGDIIVVASTGSQTLIGKTGFVDRDIPKTQIGAFLRIVRPKQKTLSPYIRLLFQTDAYKDYIRNVAKGSNINNVKNAHLQNYQICLPPLVEQQRIVAKIEELFSVLDNIQNALEA